MSKFLASSVAKTNSGITGICHGCLQETVHRWKLIHVPLNKGFAVILNVYDLNDVNQYLYHWGLGVYHSGVEVCGVEYTFGGGGGIFYTEPKNAPGAKHRESIPMGTFNGTTRDLESIVNDLRGDFDGSAYNILTKNCNHFADALVLKLLKKPVPAYINRLAFYGSSVSCLLPPSLTGVAPVDVPSSHRPTNDYQHIRSSGRDDTRSPMFTGTSGVKLGSTQTHQLTSSQDSNDSFSDNQSRKERMRAAALSRLAPQQANVNRSIDGFELFIPVKLR
eukprot:gene9303-19310_t